MLDTTSGLTTSGVWPSGEWGRIVKQLHSSLCSSDGVGRSMWGMSKLNDWRNEFLAKNCGVKLRRTKYELSSMVARYSEVAPIAFLKWYYCMARHCNQ